MERMGYGMAVKRVVFIKGAVETLGFFSIQMAEALKEMGMEAWFWDMKSPLGSREAFEKEPGWEGAVLVTFNFIGLSGEAQFQAGDGKTVWEAHGIKMFCIMVDHPMYYYKRLEANTKDLVLICIDRGHQAFVEKYYPSYGKAHFLPLAGTRLDGIGIPFQEREIDVVFTGNYVPAQNLTPHIQHMDQESKAFYFDIIKELINRPGVPMEEMLIGRLKQEFPAITREETLSCLHSMVFIDLYVRSYFRQKVICALAEHNIQVLAVGKDWEKAGCRRPQNITMAGMADSRGCLEYMGHAKIAVNVMPWFKDGAHDRIFNGMLQGCVAMTDSSKYLEEILQEGPDYTGFTLEHCEEVASKAAWLLENPKEAAEIAGNGFQKDLGSHTWAHRAFALLETIRRCCEKLPSGPECGTGNLVL